MTQQHSVGQLYNLYNFKEGNRGQCCSTAGSGPSCQSVDAHTDLEFQNTNSKHYHSLLPSWLCPLGAALSSSGACPTPHLLQEHTHLASPSFPSLLLLECKEQLTSHTAGSTCTQHSHQAPRPGRSYSPGVQVHFHVTFKQCSHSDFSRKPLPALPLLTLPGALHIHSRAQEVLCKASPQL